MRKKMNEYDVVIEQDENRVYVAYVLELPGCHTQGDTISEVMANAKEAIELCLDYNKRKLS